MKCIKLSEMPKKHARLIYKQALRNDDLNIAAVEEIIAGLGVCVFKKVPRKSDPDPLVKWQKLEFFGV